MPEIVRHVSPVRSRGDWSRLACALATGTAGIVCAFPARADIPGTTVTTLSLSASLSASARPWHITVGLLPDAQASGREVDGVTRDGAAFEMSRGDF